MIAPPRTSRGPWSAALAALVALSAASSGLEAHAGLTLVKGSSATTTYSVRTFDTASPDSGRPVFVDDVLLDPGTSAGGYNYPRLKVSPSIEQTPSSRTATRDNQNFTLLAGTSTVIDPVAFGSGSNSTTVSRTLSNNGTVANNAGISFNPGSFVSSSPASAVGTAIVSVTEATAFFRVDDGTTDPILPGVYLDVAGYVRGGPGSYVAAGLKGVFRAFDPDSEASRLIGSFELVTAYAGPGTQIAPAGGTFNVTSPPSGFDFEAISSLLFDPVTLEPGKFFILESTLTLIADPDARIELVSGTAPPGTVPGFGTFAGGPVSGPSVVAVPEPATILGLLSALPVAVAAARARRRV